MPFNTDQPMSAPLVMANAHYHVSLLGFAWLEEHKLSICVVLTFDERKAGKENFKASKLVCIVTVRHGQICQPSSYMISALSSTL